MALIGICPSCKEYNVLTCIEIYPKQIASICIKCKQDVKKPKNGFAEYLKNRACNFRDNGEQIMLNAIKVEARKACNNGFITPVELVSIERIFITLHPI